MTSKEEDQKTQYEFTTEKGKRIKRWLTDVQVVEWSAKGAIDFNAIEATKVKPSRVDRRMRGFRQMPVNGPRPRHSALTTRKLSPSSMHTLTKEERHAREVME